MTGRKVAPPGARQASAPTPGAPEDAPNEATAAVADHDPNLLSKVFQRATEQRTNAAAFGTGKGEVVPRRYRTFLIDAASCAPDLFVDGDGDPLDFELTMKTLTSAEEIGVFRGVDMTTGQASIAFELAKASIHSMNGTPVTRDQRDFLWEALGPGGRQLALAAFNTMGGMSAEAMGKMLASVKSG